MATVRGSSRVAEENDLAARESKVAKVGQNQPAGTKRKALGEISNIQSGVVTRSQANKEKVPAQKPADLKDPTAAARARVANRKAAADKAVVAQPAQRVSALQARAKPARQPRQDAASLTSVLQARSEQAVTQIKAPQPAADPSSPLPDIDSLDRKDPLAVTEYVNDIFDYYRRAEPKYRVSPAYMESQKEINQKMRAILVDWLVEVHAKFKLVPETLFLTVNVIDRFLEAKEVTRKNLQLVGVTAMLIGSKYEEIWAPEVRDFIYISDKAYNKEQILGMEKLMLNTLKFELSLPTPFNFLLRFLKACGARQDRQVEWLSHYLAELALVDYSMLKYSYSLTSAAAIYVAMKTLNRIEPYPKALARHSRYSEDAVKPCAMAIVELMQKAPSASLTAVYKKYSNQKFGEVAKLDPPMWLLEESMETSSA